MRGIDSYMRDSGLSEFAIYIIIYYVFFRSQVPIILGISILHKMSNDRSDGIRETRYKIICGILTINAITMKAIQENSFPRKNSKPFEKKFKPSQRERTLYTV